ncbi:TolC family outer membrane protein [Castellaniella sp. GW247-6E4]|uniref:TolC family outer membrane protein n=1 Tax=Castellaniella sp. GW247-6E4 TaxID=3140380 RepID=UPI0033158F5B
MQFRPDARRSADKPPIACTYLQTSPRPPHRWRASLLLPTALIGVAVCGWVGAAQFPPASGTTLREVVEKSIVTNPEILAQFQAFQSALEGQNITRGALRPEIQLQGQTGHEWRGDTPGAPPSDWHRNAYSLQLTQLLYDGFTSINSVRKLGLEKVSKYYELLATTDTLAADAINAYLDLQRYRQMIALAKDNYRIHEHTLKLLAERESSGVGRGVDYEQAVSRLALAQTNLITESNNLISVEQRYRRIAGEAPPERLAQAPDVTAQIPVRPTDFLPALASSPGILSKQALLLAADAARDAARGRFAPTIQLRAGTGVDTTLPDDSSRNLHSSSVAVVLSYNLYRGGADAARLRQSAADRYAARDVRDYTCRNAQQELALTWSNMTRLQEQLPFLRQREQAMNKVSIAAEEQFRIGQRSLLDLLDTSNELFEARRAHLNGEFDLVQQQYRWLALAHRVLAALDIAPPNAQAPDEAGALALSRETLAACAAPAPDTRSLQPMAITYHKGMAPPTLSPSTGTPGGDPPAVPTHR